MILLAILLAAELAPGCRRLDNAIRCELAPPVRVAPPPPPLPLPLPPRIAGKAMPRRTHPLARPHPTSSASPPPTPAEIAHHVDALIAIADCTGARTLLAATGPTAAADVRYRTCIGAPPPPSGRDLVAVPAEAAPARTGAEIVEHPH